MTKLSCLIIEDEPIAADIVRSYMEQVAFLHLEGICGNALSALELLRKTKVDVIFLDIHLPRIKGIDFLKSLPDPPRVIITSAYEQYALEGFELEIIDYLLKPFSFSRFLKAVNRLPLRAGEQSGEQLREQRPHLLFNVNKKMVKVFLDEILYIESIKEYVKIHLPGRFIVVKFQIGELEQQLDPGSFLRVHRSFIVAKAKIDSYTSDTVEIAGIPLPIGRSFSDAVRQEIRGRH